MEYKGVSNADASKMPEKITKKFVTGITTLLLLTLLTSIPICFIMGTSVQNIIIISLGFIFFTGFIFIFFIKLTLIMPENIIYSETHLLTFKKSKEKKFRYASIKQIAPLRKKDEKIEEPIIYFVVVDDGLFQKTIYLTKENAILLAKQLDEKGIIYKKEI